MASLHKRIGELERGTNRLCLLLVSTLPSDGRETVTYQGNTYTQAASETAEQFRARLGEGLKGNGKFLYLTEVDEAL